MPLGTNPITKFLPFFIINTMQQYLFTTWQFERIYQCVFNNVISCNVSRLFKTFWLPLFGWKIDNKYSKVTFIKINNYTNKYSAIAFIRLLRKPRVPNCADQSTAGGIKFLYLLQPVTNAAIINWRTQYDFVLLYFLL